MSGHREHSGYTGPERRSRTRAGGVSKTEVATPNPRLAPREKPAGRHGAIGSKLPTLGSYREWVNEIRNKWEEDK